LLPSLESKFTSDSSLTGDSRIPGLELEVEDDREAESESSNDGVCSGALVDNSETTEPELEIDNNNLEKESEMSGNRICR